MTKLSKIGRVPKGLITPRGYGFFLSKNHVIEIIFIFSECQYFFILSEIEEFYFGFKNLQLFIL